MLTFNPSRDPLTPNFHSGSAPATALRLRYIYTQNIVQSANYSQFLNEFAAYSVFFTAYSEIN